MWLEIENHRFLVSKGDVIFIPPNQLHGAYQYRNHSSAFFAIVFDPFFVASYSNDQIQQSYVEPIMKNPERFFSHISSDNCYLPRLQQIIISIIEGFNESYAYEIFIKSKLMEFLYVFYMIHPEDNSYMRSKEDIIVSIRIKKILLFIENNYKSPLTLDIISSHIGISKEHFCRFFKKNFHLSFTDYLTRYRITKAEQLLKATDSPIIDIALETGFDSANYFTVVFKKIKGMTPSQFRKKAEDLAHLYESTYNKRCLLF